MKNTQLHPSIPQLERDIERMDQHILDLTAHIETLENLLMRMIEQKAYTPDLLTSIDYVMLKRNASSTAVLQLPLFLIRIQKDYQFSGIIPTLTHFHSELLTTLSIDEKEQENYPIEISKQLIHEKLKSGVFDVGEKILNNQ
ncbi:hypothetical protein [Bacillales bacterium]|uniref:hypothetical protein n=1 Tax=Exiguobacterium sp. S22-S28 TaxID=3342768 RepID=UPI0011CB3E48